MIIDKDISVEITGYNSRFYKDWFPEINKGDVIIVNQLELSPRSSLEVWCKCDNCNTVFKRLRRNIHSENTFCIDKCRGEYIKLKNKKPRKNEILNKIKSRIDKNQSIKYNDIKEQDPQLLYALDRHYSLNEILRDLGISEEESVNKFGLTRNINKKTLDIEEIIERLNYLESINRLTTSAMRTEFDDLRLETSIKKIFGSVENCFDELGYSRDIYSNNILIQMGREFEDLFKSILKELDIKNDYQKPLPNGYIPDFQLFEDNIIMDTKLSSWTSSIVEDIQKYSPHCKELIFVYLREGSVIPNYGGNVKLHNAEEYLNMLPSNRRKYYEGKLQNILSYHP